MFITGYIPVFKQLIDAFDAVIQFFHDSVGLSWGFSIIALTVCVRAVLVPLTLAPYFVGFSGLPYGIAAGLLGLVFLHKVYRVMADRQDATGRSLTGDKPAKAAFKYSIYYLFALFGALAIDRLVN